MIKKFHLFDKVTHNMNITDGQPPKDIVNEKRTKEKNHIMFIDRIRGNEARK